MTSWVHHPMPSSGELAVELVEVTTLSALSGRKTMRSDTEPGSQGVSYSAIRLQSNETPKPIITLLHREIASILALPNMKDSLPALGFEPVTNTPEEFADRIKEDFETWGKLIRMAHLREK
jgi:tripartite-type tricarboxylate transporter receptor subunit TctC